MPERSALPPASLVSLEPYRVPEGAALRFRYTRETTDGFMRGDVFVIFRNGETSQAIAHNIPVTGTSKTVRAMGDYARLFPEVIPVAPPGDTRS